MKIIIVIAAEMQVDLNMIITIYPSLGSKQIGSQDVGEGELERRHVT